MSRAKSGRYHILYPCRGGDTLALWRWQGKANRIKALPGDKINTGGVAGCARPQCIAPRCWHRRSRFGV